MRVENHHDKFFKETFSNEVVARDFIKNYVPESLINIIDLDTLESQKDSFISKDLKEFFSDLLFKTRINNNEGYIYFLFEHKSYVSKNITLQLLKYMVEIWDAKIRKENTLELPVVIPLVVYHDRAKWNVKLTLGEMIKGYEEFPEDVKKYIPNFQYLMYDVSKYSDEEIKGVAQLKIVLSILRDLTTKDGKTAKATILRSIDHLRQLEDKQTGTEYLETLLSYIFSVASKIAKEDMEDIIEKVKISYPEGSDVVMTLAEKFREEGELRGIEKGKKEGRINTLSETAIELLTIKFGKLPEDIKNDIPKLDDKTLQILIRSIFEFKSLDDVRKYI